MGLFTITILLLSLSISGEYGVLAAVTSSIFWEEPYEERMYKSS